MVVPFAHRETLFEMTVDEWLSARTLLHYMRGSIETQHHPDGGTSDGRSCPQEGRPFHTLTATSSRDIETSCTLAEVFGGGSNSQRTYAVNAEHVGPCKPCERTSVLCWLMLAGPYGLSR